MTVTEKALQILSRAESSNRWEHAAAELRGICHREAGLACERCQGRGSYTYGSGATWREGMGVSAMTDDVCDVCWGTGRSDLTGVDLRELEGRARRLENEHGRAASAEWLAGKLGVQFYHVRELLPPLASRLRNLRSMDFWTAQLCDRMASALEEMARPVVSETETSGSPTINES